MRHALRALARIALPVCLLCGACRSDESRPSVSTADFVRAEERLREADEAYAAQAWSRAIALYEEALGTRPLLARDAWLRLASCHEQNGDPASACLRLEQGRLTYGGDPAILKALAALYEHRGKITYALDCCEEAHRRSPGDAEAARAVERLRAAVAAGMKADNSPSGPAPKGVDGSADPPSPAAAKPAEAEVRRIGPPRADTPRADDPVDALAALLAEGKTAAAVERYTKDVGPSDSAVLHARAGMQFLHYRQFGPAAEALLRALELNPEDAEICGTLGDLRLAEGKSDEAVNWYKRGLDLAPDDEGLKAKMKAAGQPK